jgi:U3 small nucleolar RNA-associated protein 15
LGQSSLGCNMSKSYAKLELKSFPQKKQRETAEGRYWKKFRNPVNHQQTGPITCIHFSPVAPYDYLVTASARVQIFNSSTHEVRHAISRFKDIAYSARYRKDGRLIVVGGEFPVVRVFESNTRKVLREMKAHKQPVRLTTWTADGKHVISGSDDKTVRVWDLSTGQSTRRFSDHTDYVRCAAVTDSSPDTFVSGSYDHSIKFWDTRVKGGCSTSFDHGMACF